MKLPLSLIKSYLPLHETLTSLSETLTLLGIEVDHIQNETPRFTNVIAATVQSTAPHPAASKLQIAQVDDGEKIWQVVCGASNCRPGLKVAFARSGALLYDTQDKEHRIAATQLRGIESHGMLCSAQELGLQDEVDGLIELPPEIPNGQDLTDLLWNPVLELSFTPNLGHCMSALGVARELSAALQRPLHISPPFIAEQGSPIQKKFHAEILDSKRCPRYACRAIENVQIGPSPFWLRRILLAAGLRPINNAVDATNYILLKTGQPLHAFDAKAIDKGTLYVQVTDTPSLFLGLDGIEREIPPGSLVISDGKKHPLALAGILGGANSSVTDSTQHILLEAACFDALTIRKTARQLDLRTESSQHFEKGVDQAAIPTILDEAASLIASLTGGQISQGMIDIEAPLPSSPEITLREARVNAILGTQLSLGEIEEILYRLDCKTDQTESSLQVRVPSYRHDLKEEIDLVEEVARIYGYNNIEKKIPRCTTSQLPHDPMFLFERKVRRRLAGLGLQEILTCDLISPKLADLSENRSNLLKVLHAKSEEYSVLRPSLLPGFLEVIHSNLDWNNPTLCAFELGHVYFKQESQPQETAMLAIALYGKNRPNHWEQKSTEADFYDLKGLLESLLQSLGITDTLFHATTQHPSFHPGRQAHLNHGDLRIGSFGELHPHILAKLDIKERVLFAELNLAYLFQLQNPHVKMAPIPSFPSTERDWTLTLPSELYCEQLFRAIRSLPSPLFEKVELIDLYVFEEEGKKKRNATVRFTYRDPLKTISFEEAETLHAKILAHTTSLLKL